MLPGYRRLPKPVFAANQFLCLETTLQCGQVFGWAPDVGTQATTWTGVIHDNVVTLCQKPGDKAADSVKYRVYDECADDGGVENLLTEWLGLGSDLTTIAEGWPKIDPERTNAIMDAMKGLRVIRLASAVKLGFIPHVTCVAWAQTRTVRVPGVIHMFVEQQHIKNISNDKQAETNVWYQDWACGWSRLLLLSVLRCAGVGKRSGSACAGPRLPRQVHQQNVSVH